MRPNIVLMKLSIVVSSLDNSYMPHIINVSVGNTNSLKQLKEVKIDP